jgi:hypothetical protein
MQAHQQHVRQFQPPQPPSPAQHHQQPHQQHFIYEGTDDELPVLGSVSAFNPGFDWGSYATAFMDQDSSMPASGPFQAAIFTRACRDAHARHADGTGAGPNMRPGPSSMGGASGPPSSGVGLPTPLGSTFGGVLDGLDMPELDHLVVGGGPPAAQPQHHQHQHQPHALNSHPRPLSSAAQQQETNL